MSRQILLVEDNADLAEMSCHVLELHGYLVIPALSGKQAIKLLKTVSPDLILLDLTLPDMGPVEFRSALEQSKDSKDVPLVVLSGRADSKKWADEIRADGHMTKPYEFKKLLELVESLISTFRQETPPSLTKGEF